MDASTKPWALPGTVTPDNTQTNAPPSPNNPLPPTQVERDPQTAPEPTDAEEQVTFKRIRLQGNTLLDPSTVEDVVAPYLNRPITFNDVSTLTDALSLLYAKKGYLTSSVYLPEQEITNDELILQSQEVLVDTITLDLTPPGRHFYPWFISPWFTQRSILPYISMASGDPLNVDALQRRIALLNQNPDRTVSAKLLAGKQPGTSSVALRSMSRFPIHLTPFWDNLGRRPIGHNRFGATLTHNNLLGFGDTLSTTWNASEASSGVFSQYQIPVHSSGTQLGFTYAYSNVTPQGALADLDVVSKAHTFSASVEQPLLFSDKRSLWAGLAFDWKNLRTDLVGEPFTEDHIRLLRPYFRGSFQDAWGRTLLNQEFGIGLDMWGGTQGDTPLNRDIGNSKPGSGTQFFNMTGGITRVQRLPWQLTGVLRSNYQWSNDRLFATEQMQVGGAFTTRGYKEGLYLGDSGANLTAECYIPSLLFPRDWKLPLTHQPLRQALQWVVFTDVAQIVTHQPKASESRNETLLGTGVGLRLTLTKYLVGRLDIGFPLLKPSPDKSFPRLHFGLQTPLF
ncbi:MAG: ShlB/FhaC/HecB family hemolysin secretion/activation protein [Vampirovibrionales bacterium]|nr:ShlB/FhaC/HecB family hemolysin secretion/activation protein [Vampirovibrionales bacterium]